MDIDCVIVQTLLSTSMDQFLVKCSLLQNDAVNNFSKRACHALNSRIALQYHLTEDSQQHNDSWITILDCCIDYKRNVTNNICMPVCTYECQENAYCFFPEIYTSIKLAQPL